MLDEVEKKEKRCCSMEFLRSVVTDLPVKNDYSHVR